MPASWASLASGANRTSLPSTDAAALHSIRGHGATGAEARAKQGVEHRSGIPTTATLYAVPNPEVAPGSGGCGPDGAPRHRLGLHRCFGCQAAREWRDIHSGGKRDEHIIVLSARATSPRTRWGPWCCPSIPSLMLCKHRDRARSLTDRCGVPHGVTPRCCTFAQFSVVAGVSLSPYTFSLQPREDGMANDARASVEPPPPQTLQEQ